jgi:hypothetical protein
MIQATTAWAYDRLGQYRTVTITTEYVSPELGEILLRANDGALFSILCGKQDLLVLHESLIHLLRQVEQGDPDVAARNPSQYPTPE